MPSGYRNVCKGTKSRNFDKNRVFICNAVFPPLLLKVAFLLWILRRKRKLDVVNLSNIKFKHGRLFLRVIVSCGYDNYLRTISITIL